MSGRDRDAPAGRRSPGRRRPAPPGRTPHARSSAVSTVARVAPSQHPPAAHHDQVVGVPGGEVEVVQHHHDRGPALGVERAEQVEQVDLVGDVEVRRRLVEQQDPRAAGPAPSRSRPAAAGRRRAPRPAARRAPGCRSPPAPARRPPRPPGVQRRNTPWCGYRPRPTRSPTGDPLRRHRLLRQQPEHRRPPARGAIRRDVVAVEQRPCRPRPGAAAGRARAAAWTCRTRWRPTITRHLAGRHRAGRGRARPRRRRRRGEALGDQSGRPGSCGAGRRQVLLIESARRRWRAARSGRARRSHR